jgi:hypothetical protein
VFKGKKPLVPPLPLGAWSNKPSVNAAAIEARKSGFEEASGSTEATRAQTIQASGEGETVEVIKGELYCKECYLPLHPDPPAGKLFIFLHALRYTTSHGSFETEMPWWSDRNWEGQGWMQY